MEIFALKKRFGILFLTAALLTASGCSGDPALSAYEQELGQFYESFSVQTAQLENIDPSSEQAADELLSALDGLAELTGQFAEIEVPESYREAGVSDLAASAADHMAEAGTLYRDACRDGESFDSQIADAAHTHYLRAMQQINHIAVMLQGRTPEGDDITVIPQDTPDWSGGESSENRS